MNQFIIFSMGRIPLCMLLAILLLTAGCATTSSVLSVLEDAKSPYVPFVNLEKETILHVPTGTPLNSEQLFDLLSGSRVIYIGETHDNIENHRVQLDIIKGLEKKFPGKIAVGMEMFTQPAQPALDQWLKGELGEKEIFRTWLANWGYDYRYYKPILEFARGNKIPVVALNAPKEQVRNLSKKGIEGLTHEEKKALPEMDASDPYYAATAKAIFGDHSHGAGLDSFLKVQILWDESMAQRVAEFLKDPANKDKKMVVLAGGGHVQYGIGIPRRVFRRLPDAYSIVLPITPRLYSQQEAEASGQPHTHADAPRMMQVQMPDIPLNYADFVWAVDFRSIERERVKLGVQLLDDDGKIKVGMVMPGSAAEKGGVKAGDVLLSMDKEELKDVADASYMLLNRKKGETSQLVLTRDGNQLEVAVQFEEAGRH